MVRIQAATEKPPTPPLIRGLGGAAKERSFRRSRDIEPSRAGECVPSLEVACSVDSASGPPRLT